MTAAKRGTGGVRGFLRSRAFQTVAIVLLLLAGPVSIVVGSLMMGADQALEETGVHTTGTVTAVRDGVKASRHRFSVEYLAADGSTHRVWAEWPVDGKPTVGDAVTVIYRADDPGTAVLEGFDGPGTSIVGVGVVLTGVSLLICGALFVGFLIRLGRRRPGQKNTAPE